MKAPLKLKCVLIDQLTVQHVKKTTKKSPIKTLLHHETNTSKTAVNF